MKKLFSSIAIISIASLTAFGQTISLLKEINPSGYSNPEYYTEYNGKLYFSADDGTHGIEVWVTDGTTAGTNMLKDIKPGSADSDPTRYTVYNGKMYFSANDGVHGTEPWVTDGTSAGTVMLKDISPGSGGAASDYIVFNGQLYFWADDGVHGRELWTSDGTAGGTIMVLDIRPGVLSGFPFNFYECNGKLYFQANDGTHGEELWVTDGTAAGTTMVMDINPGTGTGFPSQVLYEFNGKLYFRANDVIHGEELWVTDGTVAGTTMLMDIFPGNGDATPTDFIEYNNNLYFRANDGVNGSELWRTDGTTAGTAMFMDINPGISDGVTASYFTAYVYNGKLYFIANDGTHGKEIWVTDGTVAGTSMLKDIYPGINDALPMNFIEYNGKLYFTAEDGVNGFELWSTEGTTAGTQVIIPPFATSSGALEYSTFFKVFNNELYFAAAYDSYMNYEPYKLHTPTSIPTYAATDNNLTLYPNPATNRLTIQHKGEIKSISIFNSIGQLVLLENTSTFSVESLHSGLYCAQIETSSGTATAKFIKQ